MTRTSCPRPPCPSLLLPTSGPWMKFGEAADYVRAVRPQQIVQIHEMLLSDIGLHLAEQPSSASRASPASR